MNQNTRRTSIPALGRFRAYTEALVLARMVRTLQITGHLRDQLFRATESVVLNLAEGACDATRAQKARYFGISRTPHTMRVKPPLRASVTGCTRFSMSKSGWSPAMYPPCPEF